MEVSRRVVVNAAFDQARVELPVRDAAAFHASLPGYAPTPVRTLPAVTAELGLAAVLVKDESDRLGLPAFKILGASWAAERALDDNPEAHLLVAASAGNHGRAVARVARDRGLRCRIYLPARALAARREAIEREGAEVVVVDGTYEDAVAAAVRAGAEPDAVQIADVGHDGPAASVIDGYATLFAEASAQAVFDVIVVPAGVGSLAAAAARHAAGDGTVVVAAEPRTAACLAASLDAGVPTRVPTSGTTMAGLDCAEISQAAWPFLRHGIRGVVAVDDEEAASAVEELDGHGLEIGHSGAAPLAALRALSTDVRCDALRTAIGLGSTSRVLLVATEGRTDRRSGRA